MDDDGRILLTTPVGLRIGDSKRWRMVDRSVGLRETLGVACHAGVNRDNDSEPGNPPMLRKHLGDNAIDSVYGLRLKLNRIDEHSENCSSLPVEVTFFTHGKSLSRSRSHNRNPSRPIVVIVPKCGIRDISRMAHSDGKDSAAQSAGRGVLRCDRSIASEPR